jgi:hypothetical protein
MEIGRFMEPAKVSRREVNDVNDANDEDFLALFEELKSIRIFEHVKTEEGG